MFQVGSKALQFGEPTVNLGRVMKDHVENVAAGNLASLSKPDDLANLAEREPNGLGGPHELETPKDLFVVVAVAVRRALGRGEDTDVFVVPHRLDAQPAAPG
jgi:hypothetical protein